MKRLGFILAAVLPLAIPGFSQIVDIPDPNFLEALIKVGVDTDGDSLISYSEAESVTDLKLTIGRSRI